MPTHSKALTCSLLEEREEAVSRSILSQVATLIEPERNRDLSPHIWVFWGESCEEIFNGIARCIQYFKDCDNQRDDKRWPGAVRPMHVYEGHKHSMRDFLDLPEDGGIAFVHQAHRLRGKTTENYFRGFKKLFESKHPQNQIVFLSQGPFLRQLPEMEHVRITDGKVDVDWFWPPDEPGQIDITTTYDPSNPTDVEKAFEVEWAKIVAANPTGLRHVLSDPRKRAQLKAAALKEVREDTVDIAQGRKPRSSCPIRMR